MNNLISRRLIIRSANVKLDPLSYVPCTEYEYRRLIAYEPSNRLKRIKALIEKYREQSNEAYARLIAF